jgi:hypothetical protein
MEFVDALTEIHRLEDGGDWGKLVELTEMAEAFPDLRLHRDHWGRVRFCSREINGQIGDFEVEPCSICDHAIKIWLYGVIDAKGKRIYSDPPYFVVAHRNVAGFGVIPTKDWEQVMEAAGVSRFVIGDVRRYLSGHPPINYLGE